MPVRRRPATVGTLLLATALAFGACTGTGSSAPDGPAGSAGGSSLPVFGYVAMGDSFTAAPGIPETDRSDGCLRSTHNYPALVARQLSAAYDVELDDRSCIGADTTDLTHSQSIGGGRLPPQVDALDGDTDLVTVSIGGNDFAVFTRLITGCLTVSGEDPAGSPCQAAADLQGDVLSAVLPKIRQRLVRALREIGRRAPDAQVLVVGYPQVAPAAGECPDRMPFAAGDVAFVRSVNHALTDNLADAAQRTGTTYVDVWAASAGHDICAEEPWVNGQQAQPDGAIPFHPLPTGQEAIADLVVDAVRG